MKKQVTILVTIEISSKTTEGFKDGLGEALARIQPDFILSSQGEEVVSRLVEKDVDRGPAWDLIQMISQKRRVSIENFFNARDTDAMIARHMFAFCARRWLSWGWNDICQLLGRERTGLIVGVESIKSLTAKKTARVKISKNILKDRDNILSDLNEISIEVRMKRGS